MTPHEPAELAPERSRGRAVALRVLDLLTWLGALLSLLAVTLTLRDTPRAPTAAQPPATHGREHLDATQYAELCVDSVDPKGAAVGNAEVRAYIEQPGRRFAPSGSVRTGSDGRGCLARVPRGSLWLLAEAPGFARASTQIVLEGDRVVPLQLLAAHTLRVKVLDELGAPLPRATVLVRASDPLPYGFVTDAQGQVEFAWLPPPPWSVSAVAGGYETATQNAVSADLTLALRRLASIDVRVVDASDTPLSSASVLIAGASLWPARRAETNAEGIAKIRGLSAGSYDLRALRGTLVSEPRVGFELARGAHENVTLRLTEGRMVNALVTDGDAPDAAPVSGADVVLVEGGLGSFPLQGRSGADGRLTLGPIARGPASLAASAPDFVPSPLVAVPETMNAPLRVPLVRGGTLRGEVVDARGFPIGGATIEVVGLDRLGLPIAQTPQSARFRAAHFAWALAGPPGLIPAGELGVMPGPVPPIPPPGLGAAPAGTTSEPLAPLADVTPWVTSANGTFEAHPITPGRVRALVRHPEYVEAASELVALAAGGEARVRVVMLRGGSLEGRVVDERGFPVAAVEVSVTAERGTFERSTLTASDGAFAFAAVPENVELSVTRPNDAARIALRKKVKVPEGARERLELVLPAPREAVMFRVVDDHDVPVDLAEVRVVSLDPAVTLRSTLFTNGTGNAELSDARGVALRVVVEAPRFARLEQSFGAAPAEIRLALDPGVRLRGHVSAVRGRRSVSSALVTLRAGSLRMSTMSDSDGNYHFAGVAPGHVELQVTHPDYAEASASAEITRTTRDDRPFELAAIDLSEGAEIEGEVVDERGAPVAGARVALGVVPTQLPAGALPPGVTTSDAHGAFSLRGVRAGTLSVSAYASGVGRGVLDNVVTNAGRTTRGVRIRLSERVAEDEALADASVAATLVERGSGSLQELMFAQVAQASEAERDGLVAGDVINRIDGERPSSLADARGRLAGRAGSDVVLDVLRSGAPLTLRVTREAVRR